MAIRTARGMLTVVLRTKAGTTVTLDNYSGEVSLSGITADQAERTRHFDRGRYVGTTLGNDTAVSLSISGVKHDGVLTHAVTAKAFDILNHQGSVSAETQTTDPEQAWGIEVDITITHPGGGTDTVNLYNVQPDTEYSTAVEGNTLSISAECWPASEGAKPFLWS